MGFFEVDELPKPVVNDGEVDCDCNGDDVIGSLVL
jgi:hypothetical protein